jgi:hypothetical protein
MLAHAFHWCNSLCGQIFMTVDSLNRCINFLLPPDTVSVFLRRHHTTGRRLFMRSVAAAQAISDLAMHTHVTWARQEMHLANHALVHQVCSSCPKSFCAMRVSVSMYAMAIVITRKRSSCAVIVTNEDIISFRRGCEKVLDSVLETIAT